jgi:hypothetical protein
LLEYIIPQKKGKINIGVNNKYGIDLTMLGHLKKSKGQRVGEWGGTKSLRGILEIPYTLWNSNDPAF